MIRLILLGTGIAVPDPDRGHTHMLWDGPGGPLLIDAGGCTFQRLLHANIDPLTLRALFVTHSHTDHINGIPALLTSMYLAGRTDPPLPIYGPQQAIERVRDLLSASDMEPYCTPVDWRPLIAGASVPLPHGWQLHTALTRHSRPCLAVRFESPDGKTVLVYTADTAPCPAVTELARGATVLLHEATLAEPSAHHSTPGEAGALAQQVGAKRLVLVHFSPTYTMEIADAVAQIRAAGFTGDAEVGTDLQVITLDTA